MSSFSAFGESLLVNGSFEANSVVGNHIAFLSADYVPGWSSWKGEKLEIWDSGASGVASRDGSNHLELDNRGTRTITTGFWPFKKTTTIPSELDGIYQDVQTEEGQTYLLTFDVRARGSNFNSDDEAVVVEWNGVKTKVDGYRADTAGEWTTITVEVEGTGGRDRLLFRESSTAGANDATGPFLDNIQLHAANRVPDAVNDIASTNVDTSVTLNVLGNDNDPDGDALTVTSLNGQPIAPGQTVATNNGSVTLLANGELSFMPNTGFIGNEGFFYQISDGKGGEDTALAQVTVNGPVDPGTGKIGNRVFFDENANGILDNGESGLQGVRVTLKGAGADGQFGTADDISRIQDINNDGGYYGFDNLNGGQYKISFSNLPAGITFTQANVGGNDAIDSDADPITGMTEVIQLVAGERRNDIDAGVVQSDDPAVDPGTGKIGNRVFLDENGNGILDNGESGVTGIRVTLEGAGGDGQFGTADDIFRIQDINNDAGYYGFDNLNGGRYKVSFGNLPAGTTLTQANVGGNDAIDSDANPGTGMTEVIQLLAGERRNDIDAGVVQSAGPVDPGTGKIGNRLFLDENGNGILDNGESGVKGVRVTLSGSGGDGQFGTADDISRIQDINNDGGYYGFDNLNAGQYKVTFSNLPLGASFTQANVGNNDALDSDVDATTGVTNVIQLSVGEHRNDIDAGVVKPLGGIKNEIFGTEQSNWPLKGTNGNDSIFGLGGNDKLEGLDGDDHLTAGSGNDHVLGGSGNDSLNGTDNVALGKLEIDQLTGGAGRDRFILGNNDQAYYLGGQWDDFAIINDFQIGKDLAVLNGSADQYVIETNLAYERSVLYRLGKSAGMPRDAIAVFEGNPYLSLASPSFEFINAETGQLGFQSGSYPPLASLLTQGETPASVELTEAGALVDFSNSIIINVGFDPTNNEPAFSAELRGETQLLFGEAEDAIVNDPLLGSFGSLDGRYDVSRSKIVTSTATGATPLGDFITVNIGDGSPDLVFDPVSQDAPPFDLQSGGIFLQESDALLGGTNQLNSFYEIFLEIQDAPNGTLRNLDPIIVNSDFGDSIYSGEHLNLKYSSGSITPLYAAGPDGEFWTGDEVVAAKLVPGVNGNALTVNLASQLV